MLVEAAVLSVILAASAERYEAGKRNLCLTSPSHLTLTVAGSPDTSFGLPLEEALAKDLSFVAEVRHVLLERADTNFLVWIALDDPTRQVREKVFRKELELIEGFPEIDFDFNIIPAKNKEARSISSSAKVIYSRKDNNGADQG